MSDSLRDFLLNDAIYSKDPNVLFNSLAKILLNKCIIKVGEKNYRMLEIEFYLYSSNHQDLITYPRVDAGGNWFFHQSGVDICFKSYCKIKDNHFCIDESNNFGGILIRSIIEVDKEMNYIADSGPIHGPMKCMDVLFKSFGALDNNRTVEQIPYIAGCCSLKEDTVMQTQRFIPIKDGAKKKIESILSSTYSNDGIVVDIDLAANYIENNSSYLYRYYIEPQKVKLWNNYKAKPQKGKVVE